MSLKGIDTSQWQAGLPDATIQADFIICENCGSDKGMFNKYGVRKLIKGLCQKCYTRQHKHGSPNIVLHKMGENRSKDNRYFILSEMVDRCNNKNNKSYFNYGGRGIFVCDRWIGTNGFTNFIKDMGCKPFGYSIDRKDNNGNYEPNNCRWASNHTQAGNKRNNTDYVGVSYVKKDDAYLARLLVNNKLVLCKQFKLKTDAIEARKEAEIMFLEGIIV